MTAHPTAFAPDLGSDLSRAPLPRGLREKAADMSWDGFLAAYGHSAGPLELTHWECADHRGTSRCLGPQARTYQATFAVGGHSSTASASASGPIAAMTAMLHDRGFALEMLNFHQVQMGRDTVTFIRGTDGVRDDWAMSWAEDPTQSALRAVIACANRLANGQIVTAGRGPGP
jgi:hypothetical protein